MINHNRLFSFLFFILLAGCATTSTPQMTPLEISSMQTRSYENDKDIVFRSVVSVFQDLGYIIQNADIDTGLISAESSAKSDPWMAAFTGSNRIDQTKATAFVERIGKMTSLRINFVESRETSSAYGQHDRNDNAILDANVYQNAFERIEDAIFIRAAN